MTTTLMLVIGAGVLSTVVAWFLGHNSGHIAGMIETNKSWQDGERRRKQYEMERRLLSLERKVLGEEKESSAPLGLHYNPLDVDEDYFIPVRTDVRKEN